MCRRADRLCRERAAHWRGQSGYAAASFPWRQAEHAGSPPGHAATAAEEEASAALAGAADAIQNPRDRARRGLQRGPLAAPKVWGDAAAVEQPRGTSGPRDERVGAGEKGIAGAGVLRTRDMTLGQLHELIEDVFASKARADQRHAPPRCARLP